MQISTEGTAFIAGHEGFVSKAYRCPAGVLTIGYGFTMGSRTFAGYWREKHGRGLQIGDTITRTQADTILAALIAEEYGAAVNSKISTSVQHQFDGASSVSYNCGPGSLGWNWAKALARGDVGEAARLLRTTAVTANGRKLAGLVRRRSEEARLIEVGAYASGGGKAPAAVSTTRDEIKEYQAQLVSLGYKLEADGIYGPKTKAAVMEFQKAHGLKVDGLVGPATRATLIRALDAKTQAKATAGGGLTGGAGGAGVESGGDIASLPFDASTAVSVAIWAIAAAALIYGGYWLYRNRGRFTGQRVPT